MCIDIDMLRAAVADECRAAYFGGSFGAALMESFDAERATPEELVEMALRLGLDLSRYECR